MKQINSNGIEYYVFEESPFCDIQHGFFTRIGGVSPQPWQSLNLSTTAGDTAERVIENRRRIFTAVDRPVESLYDTWQVHSNRIVVANSPRGLENEPVQADGIITQNPGVTLFMRFADCVPVLFYDPEKQVVGIAHAGWKGTVNGIVAEMITVMVSSYGSSPTSIQAGIGPCICPSHYVIRGDVLCEVKNGLPEFWDKVVYEDKLGIHLDLPLANQMLLQRAGVKEVYFSNLCTAGDTTKWFSHRAEHGSTGRFGALIALGKND